MTFYLKLVQAADDSDDQTLNLNWSLTLSLRQHLLSGNQKYKLTPCGVICNLRTSWCGNDRGMILFLSSLSPWYKTNNNCMQGSLSLHRA